MLAMVSTHAIAPIGEVRSAVRSYQYLLNDDPHSQLPGRLYQTGCDVLTRDQLGLSSHQAMETLFSFM